MKSRVMISSLIVMALVLGLAACAPTPTAAPAATAVPQKVLVTVVQKVVETVMVPGATQVTVITATPQPTKVVRPVKKVGSNVQIAFQIFKDGGVIKGYEHDLYKEALNRSGYDLEVVDVAFAGIFAGLAAEKWDMVCSQVFVTKERVKTMDFTDPFFEGFEALLVPINGPVQTLADLKGKQVATETGTSQAAWTASLQAKYGPFTIRNYEQAEAQFQDLELGRVQAWGVGFSSANNRMKANPNKYKIIATSENNFMVACAVRPGDPLKAKFNTALESMKKDGTSAKIYQQYLGTKPPEGSAVLKLFPTPYVPDK